MAGWGGWNGRDRARRRRSGWEGGGCRALCGRRRSRGRGEQRLCYGLWKGVAGRCGEGGHVGDSCAGRHGAEDVVEWSRLRTGRRRGRVVRGCYVRPVPVTSVPITRLRSKIAPCSTVVKTNTWRLISLGIFANPLSPPPRNSTDPSVFASPHPHPFFQTANSSARCTKTASSQTCYRRASNPLRGTMASTR